MAEKDNGSEAETDAASTSNTDAKKALETRRLCFEHAADLIQGARRAIADPPLPHLGYHLAALALEEIGKAGMVGARLVVGKSRNTDWMNKRFGDHVWKLQWAVWTPIMSGRIDPKDFEEARRFAQSTHARRKAGLYVDQDDGASAPPRQAVRMAHATSLLRLAETRLELEQARGEPDIEKTDDNVTWFLDTMADEVGMQRLLSKEFVAKHEELKGDTHAWVVWARQELARLAAEEQEHLKRELARVPNADAERKPKWTVTVRLYTPSHSIRPKVLNYWNNRMRMTKLKYVADKKQVLLEISLTDAVPVANVYDTALSLSKLCTAALSVGSLGLFWYEAPRHASQFYERIVDVEATQFKLDTHRGPGLLGDWKMGALTEHNLQRALEFVAVFSSIPNDVGARVFGEYLRGLVLINRSDIHLSCEREARQAFLAALRNGCRHFGDWDGDGGSLLPSLHRVFQKVMPEAEDRETVFDILADTPKTTDGPFADAIEAKRLADLYFNVVSDRLWSQKAKQTPSAKADDTATDGQSA